jgi:hypothetical protein
VKQYFRPQNVTSTELKNDGAISPLPHMRSWQSLSKLNTCFKEVLENNSASCVSKIKSLENSDGYMENNSPFYFTQLLLGYNYVLFITTEVKEVRENKSSSKLVSNFKNCINILYFLVRRYSSIDV